MPVLFIFLLSNANAHGIADFNNNPKNYNVKLQIFEQQKPIAQFFVALAADANTRNYGLMNLKHLNSKHGMLFLFERQEIVYMWMKNTLIPLDMIFIDANGNIVNIRQNAVPLSLDVISSGQIIDKVLEINSGLCKKLGIKIGQKINYENF